MILKHKNMQIVLAAPHNAEYLHRHRAASGENITFEEVYESLKENESQHMIEIDGRIIGDIHYGDFGTENRIAEIGVYIRDENEKGKGYGILAMSIYIDALFNILNYEKIRIATSIDNKAMRHISENKFGLMPIIHKDESYAEYFLAKENWQNMPKPTA